MSTLPDYPLINGRRLSFAMIEAKFNGKRYIGFKSIDYSQEQDIGEVFGSHQQKLGETLNDLKPEASFEMYKEEFDVFIDDLGSGYMSKRFDIVVSYALPSGQVRTDTLRSCIIKKHADSHQKSSDALSVKVDLSLMFIKYNGKDPLPNMLRGI